LIFLNQIYQKNQWVVIKYHLLLKNKNKLSIIIIERMPRQINLTLQKQFGENLRRIRESKGLSLLDLANRSELDKSNIGKIENGKHNIQLSKIFELAKGLDVEPKLLLEFKI